MKELKILIGDDAFASEGCAKTAVTMMALGLWTGSAKEQEGPIRLEQEAGDYVWDKLPIADTARVTTVDSVGEMLKQEPDVYDIVVTDLDYASRGGPRGGLDVVQALSKERQYLLVMCTSESDPRLLQEAEQTGIDYLVRPEDMMDKFETLGVRIAEHYEK